MRPSKIGSTWIIPQWRPRQAAIAALLTRVENEERFPAEKRAALALPETKLVNLPRKKIRKLKGTKD